MSISAQPYSPVGSTPLSERFFKALGIDADNPIEFMTDQETDQVESESDIVEQGEQSDCELSPEQYSSFERKLSTIEDLINSYDFVGAAEEILKLNIGNIPQNLFSLYSNLLETTAENLSLKDTYLNAQLASQSLVVMAIKDELHENGILHAIDEAQDIQDMVSLNLKALDPELNALAGILLSFMEEGIGAADEFNPQLHPDTSVLARFMRNQTLGDHKQASIDHGGSHGQHVYNYDMKIGG